MPLCAGDILQSPAEPCPASVGDDARNVPQTLRYRKPHAAGEIARPTLRPGAGGQRISTSLPPGPSAGRCKHRPGNPAMPQTLGGGRDRPPYIAAGSGRQRISTSLPPGPCAEGRHPFKKDHKTKEHAKPLRRGAALHDRHPPAMPAVPGLASHRIRAAAGPACAAGEGMV